MFDDVPPQFWLLIAIAIVAVVPIRYIGRHMAHDPRRRDITLPAEDLEWRTPAQLTRSVALVAVLALVAIFIFTPQAEQFARSPAFLPLFLAVFGGYALHTVWRGIVDGRIEPMSRGRSWEFSRAEQPKRFWASVVWNALIGCFCLSLPMFMMLERDRDTCFRADSEADARTALPACDAWVAAADDAEERAEAQAARGQVHYWLGNDALALADYSAAIRADPQDSYALYNRALVHERTGDIASAMKDYNQSLMIRPDDADGYGNRGRILLDMGELDAAIIDFTRALRLDEANIDALGNRGIAHAWKNDRIAALVDRDRVAALDPGNFALSRIDTILALAAGDLPTAAAQLTARLQAAPDDEWALWQRGHVYWKMGQHDLARDDDDRLSRLRELNGKEVNAQEVR
ncbi:tetratricopeptide repeat protein [Croceibacterium ferulae]|uniref:tetratricopeptide repeat protein n=1 Tax=Croceibacterium ferulae TaxID=1854641 RepID=UPI000EB1A46B|nr:tetratricopeptide repeat protein [Croceibacterium ferulae]